MRAHDVSIDLLGLVLPQRCVVCRRAREPVCATCRDALPRIPPPVCDRCGAPTAWPVSRCAECAGRRLAFASARAAVMYEDGVRAFVSAWKERGLRRLARVAADVVAETTPFPRTGLVSFVPPHSDRLLERGHHPAERLARELGDCWDVEVEPLLARRGSSKRQRGLSLPDRRRNVAGVFRSTATARGTVVLIDDVYTSGATANAAASALRKAGARRIHVVTFARAVR